jgi:hypothetical protein
MERSFVYMGFPRSIRFFAGHYTGQVQARVSGKTVPQRGQLLRGGTLGQRVASNR